MRLIATLLVSALALSACSDEKTIENAEEHYEARKSQNDAINDKHQTLEDKTNALVQDSVNLINEASKEITAQAKKEIGHAVDKVAKETKESISESLGGGHDRQSMLALAKKSGCLACHALDKKVVGPAWQDVAEKYRDQKLAKSKLIVSIGEGSSGKWGKTKMPANSPKVSEEHIEQLAEFILSL